MRLDPYKALKILETFHICTMDQDVVITTDFKTGVTSQATGKEVKEVLKYLKKEIYKE